jgi:hypothetical protein
VVGTHRRLLVRFGVACLWRCSVFHWYHSLKNGRKRVSKVPRGYRFVTAGPVFVDILLRAKQWVQLITEIYSKANIRQRSDPKGSDDRPKGSLLFFVVSVHILHKRQAMFLVNQAEWCSRKLLAVQICPRT